VSQAPREKPRFIPRSPRTGREIDVLRMSVYNVSRRQGTRTRDTTKVAAFIPFPLLFFFCLSLPIFRARCTTAFCSFALEVFFFIPYWSSSERKETDRQMSLERTTALVVKGCVCCGFSCFLLSVLCNTCRPGHRAHLCLMYDRCTKVDRVVAATSGRRNKPEPGEIACRADSAVAQVPEPQRRPCMCRRPTAGPPTHGHADTRPSILLTRYAGGMQVQKD